ncbi:SCO family protein [Psychroserpens burtonensis]|uniref:SCO family protein n=1 Tax=Psychroserpens burtonensis TaxID=49278 RepID=A0A5C7BFR1_9FLAO|nr:SCO family protein [Psychroserpens burtonensis]TXE20035.1 SCO family protein [Psychroserpens burtonensis]
MKLYKINSIFSCLLFFTIVGCKETKTQEKTSRVDALPYYAEATFTPNWLDGDDENLKSFHTIPSFNLTNQLGETVSEKTFENKIYVADFFFTTCSGICPKMTANMKVLQDEFLDDDEILLLSHSVTPETDSVPTLKQYAENKGIINSKWHLVTGDRKQIYDLGRQSYFAEEDLGLDKTDEDFLHTENFVLIDQNRHIRGIYNGLNKTAVQQLIADVKTLKKEID